MANVELIEIRPPPPGCDEPHHRDDREEEYEDRQRRRVEALHRSFSRVAKYTNAVIPAPMAIQRNWYQ